MQGIYFPIWIGTYVSVALRCVEDVERIMFTRIFEM